MPDWIYNAVLGYIPWKSQLKSEKSTQLKGQITNNI